MYCPLTFVLDLVMTESITAATIPFSFAFFCAFAFLYDINFRTCKKINNNSFQEDCQNMSSVQYYALFGLRKRPQPSKLTII